MSDVKQGTYEQAARSATQVPLLEVKNLKMHFAIKQGVFAKVTGYTKAVDDISFSLYKGETVGLVGESGCGKTTIGRCIVRAYAPTSGEILFHNNDNVTDLCQLNGKALKPIRQDVRMVFQDPFSSLNPRMTVFDIIAEVLKVNKLFSGKALEDRVKELLSLVGLRPEYLRRYPHAFSGGERQRLVIARAIATNPKLVIADEATAALDVSIRAQILNLLAKLQKELDLTYLFVSHDLSVVRHICNRVKVMYVGKMVESAPTEQLFTRPRHPYTEALMSAVPISNPRQRGLRKHLRLKGEIPDPANPPSGCYFHLRCPYATEECQTKAPEFKLIAKDHEVACHHAENLVLSGALYTNEPEQKTARTEQETA